MLFGEVVTWFKCADMQMSKCAHAKYIKMAMYANSKVKNAIIFCHKIFLKKTTKIVCKLLK